jgi:putative hydrolase of the HAD superfamily
MNDSKAPSDLISNERRSESGRSDLAGITGVILDYGLVLVRSPTKAEFGGMAKIFNLPFEQFYELWETSRNPYDRGDITAEEYWLGLAARTNTTLDAAQIGRLREIEIEIWVHPYPEMVDWVWRLRAAGLKTAVLSNMPLDLAAYVRKNLSWMDDFSFKTLSAEVRSIKPEAAIYEHTLRGLGITANEALFVDDREPNIRAARALGIHGLQFSSVEQLKNDLEALGFPLLPEVAKSGSAEQPDKEIKFQL